MANFTREAIKSTFLKLLNEKPFSQITVKSLVAECGINRNSFYYHFSDLPALIEEIITEEADRIISSYPTVDSIETALNAAVSFAADNRRALLHIFNSVNRDIFEQYLWKVCSYVVSSYGESLMKGKPVSDMDRQVIEQFYRCELFGFVISWMNDHMKEDIQAHIARFCELHRGIPEEMVSRSDPGQGCAQSDK